MDGFWGPAASDGIETSPRGGSSLGTGNTRAGAWALTVLALGIDKSGRIVSSFFLARLLSKEDFGLFILILVTLMTASGVLGGGMSAAAASTIGGAASRGKEELCGALAALVALSFGVGVAVITVMVAGGSRWLAHGVFAEPAAAAPLLLFVPAVVLQTVSQSWEGALQGMRDFSAIASIRSWVAPVGLIAVIIGGVKYGLPGAVAMLAVSGALSTMAIGFRLLRLVRATGFGFFRPSVARILSMARLAVVVSVSNVTVAVSMWLGQVVLARNVGLEEVGLFGVGNQMRNLLALPATTLGVASLPFLCGQRSRRDEEGFREVATQYGVVVTGLLGCLSIFLVGCCREVLSLCYGPPMARGWLNADLLFLSLLLVSPGLVMAYVVIALDEPRHGVCVNLLWAMAYVILGWFFVGIWGYVGLGAATLVAGLVQVPFCIFYLRSRKAVDLRRIGACFLWVCVGAGIAVSVMGADETALRLAGGILGASVGTCGVWFRAFTMKERMQVIERCRCYLNGWSRRS